MKKFIAFVLVMALCLTALCSCGKTKMRMDGKTFDFAYARVKDKIRACSTALSKTYTDVRAVDYTLAADDGKLTVTGEGGTYTGEYKVYKLLEESIVYEINIGAEVGFASLSENTNDDGTVEYMLILTIKGYYVTFTSEKTAG